MRNFIAGNESIIIYQLVIVLMVSPLVVLPIISWVASLSIEAVLLMVRVEVVESWRLSLKRYSVVLIVDESLRWRWKLSGSWHCSRWGSVSDEFRFDRISCRQRVTFERLCRVVVDVIVRHCLFWDWDCWKSAERTSRWANSSLNQSI